MSVEDYDAGFDYGQRLGKESQFWPKVVVGIICTLLGGALGVWGATEYFN